MSAIAAKTTLTLSTTPTVLSTPPAAVVQAILTELAQPSPTLDPLITAAAAAATEPAAAAEATTAEPAGAAAWDEDTPTRVALSSVRFIVVLAPQLQDADADTAGSGTAVALSRTDVMEYVSQVYERFNAIAGPSGDLIVRVAALHPAMADGPDPPLPITCMGGTFDRLHIGHKALLTGAVLSTTEELKIGVTDDAMLSKKSYADLIYPVDTRIAVVRATVEALDPSLRVDVFPIHDAWGPTRDLPLLHAMIVSKETEAGGYAIKDARDAKGLTPTIAVIVISLVGVTNNDPASKVSSSILRARDAQRGAALTQAYAASASAPAAPAAPADDPSS